MIRPVLIHADGSVDVVFDEMQHTGTVPADQITWGKNMDGSEDHNLLALPCADDCGSVSYHPRESTDAMVIEMFARKDTL